MSAIETSDDLLLKGIISCRAPPCTENDKHWDNVKQQP